MRICSRAGNRNLVMTKYVYRDESKESDMQIISAFMNGMGFNISKMAIIHGEKSRGFMKRYCRERIANQKDPDFGRVFLIIDVL